MGNEHEWSEALRVTVFVVPVAQPRRTQNWRGQNYTPKNHPVQTYRAILGYSVRAAYCSTPINGPVIMSVQFFLPRPAKYAGKRYPAGPLLHTAKPDLDNLMKSTKDCLKGVVWYDDSQVVGYRDVAKFYHEKNGRPRVELVLYRINENGGNDNAEQ